MRSVRKIVTGLLLGFVALSIGLLIYKETRPLPSDESASQSVGREPKVLAAAGSCGVTSYGLKSLGDSPDSSQPISG